MNRKSFLKSIAALFGAPAVVKKVTAETPPASHLADEIAARRRAARDLEALSAAMDAAGRNAFTRDRTRAALSGYKSADKYVPRIKP